MRLEQHNIPSITPLLTVLFERSKAAECRKSLQRSESGYTDFHPRVHSESESNVWGVHNSLCQVEDECEKFSCICCCPKPPSLSLGCFPLFWHNIHSNNKSWWLTLLHESTPTDKVTSLTAPLWLPSYSHTLVTRPQSWPRDQGKVDKWLSRIPDVLHLDHDSLDLLCTLRAQGKVWILPSCSVSCFLSIAVVSRDPPCTQKALKGRDSRTCQENGAFLAEELESITQKTSSLLTLCIKESLIDVF